MAINLVLSLTLDGKDAFWNSQNTGVKLEITHLQFGTRNRQTTGEESFLNQPKQYTKIQNGSKIAPEQVRIMATMPGIENYNVAEIGLWSGVPDQVGSILIAYKSVQTGFIAQMVSGIDLVFTYDMVLSTADIDNITIIKDTDQGSTFSLLAVHETDRNAHPYYLTTDTAQTINGAKTFASKAIFTGGLSGELTGNATTSSKLATERTISFSGAATGSFNFDGSSNSSALLTLANSGVVANTYGSNLKIPVLTVNQKGLITGVSEQQIPIVDDLTTGGSTKLLSAEQGKVLNDQAFGVGQTRKSINIVSGTTYTNTKNKMITVGVIFQSTASGNITMGQTLHVNELLFERYENYVQATNYFLTINHTFLPGESYKFTASHQSRIISAWEIS